MSDLVARLRDRPDLSEVFDHMERPYGWETSLEHQAADRIQRLEDALQAIIEEAGSIGPDIRVAERIARGVMRRGADG